MIHKTGYELLTGQQGHPLAMNNGALYEHRKVLYEKIGPGTHRCHWCPRMVTWGVDLHVDHVDDDKLNNDPANLEPSCFPCNMHRTQLARAAGRVCSCGAAHYAKGLCKKHYERQRVS